MTNNKKTLYEILNVAPDAEPAAIESAYHQALQALATQALLPADIEVKRKILEVAYSTLSTPSTRAAYDSRLAGEAPQPVASANTLSLVPIEENLQIVALKKEALALKAEAMALKAEAMSLKADTMMHSMDLSMPMAAERPAKSKGKTILWVAAGLIAMLAVIQMASVLMFRRNAHQVQELASESRGNAAIENYYQETGVRVSSMAELHALEAKQRAEAAEKAQQHAAERAEQEDERKQLEKKHEYEKFVEESRRFNREVSQDLQASEREAREDEARRKRDEQERERETARDEKARQDALQEKWRRDLLR